MVKSNLIRWFGAALLGVSLIGCSSNNNGTTGANPQQGQASAGAAGLVGYWLTTGFTVPVNGQPYNPSVSTQSPNYLIANFASNQVQFGVVTTDGSGNQTGTWKCPQPQSYTTSGSTLTVVAQGSCPELDYTYTLSNGTLQLINQNDGSGGSATLSIITQAQWNQILAAVAGI